MKNYKKYINRLFLGMLSLFIFSSCSEDTMDDINKKEDNPNEVTAKFLIPQLETATAFSTIGGDFSTYVSVYVEHETGVHNQMYNAEIRSAEPTSTSTYNNPFGSTYASIMDAKNIISKCTESGSDEEKNFITLAIAKTLLAYNIAVLTDLFGDTPYKEAGIVNEQGLVVYRQPAVDKQEDIYNDIFTQLEEALVLFEKPDSEVEFSPVGANDFYYKGDRKLWAKAIYGLKARYTMRLLARSSDQTGDLNKILSYLDKSFTSSAEELKFDVYNGTSQNNPLSAFSTVRLALSGSKSFVEKLTERNDPRVSQWFMTADKVPGTLVTDPSKFDIDPNGQISQELQTRFTRLVTDFSPTAPTLLLSYHELLFLKAEAQARLNQKDNAETTLKTAIAVAFTNLARSLNSAVSNSKVIGLTVDLSSTVSDEYFAKNVKPLFDANPLKEIMIQKYLAFAGASGESVEAYNDIRRLMALNENYIELKNTRNATQFPLRLIYGADEVTSNPNVRALVGNGSYVYTENVWWAGGTR